MNVIIKACQLFFGQNPIRLDSKFIPLAMTSFNE